MRFYEKKQQEHGMDLLFVLLLFALFTFTGLCVLLIGSKIYRSTASHMEENYTTRTALAYVSEKIRQSDTSDGIFLAHPDGFDETENVLVLSRTIQDTTYYTYIYYYKDALRELFVKKGTPVTPEQGTSIVAISGFSVEEKEHQLFQLSATDQDGKTVQILIGQKSSDF